MYGYMIITVSIGEFRQNISDYLARAQAGHRIILKDEKKGEEVAEIVGKKKFDPVAFRAMLDRVAGVFTVKNHPQWATKAKIEKWLRESRKRDERNFDVRP